MKAILAAVLAVAFASTDAASATVYNVGGRVKAPVLIDRPEIDCAPCKLEGTTLDASGKV